MSGESASKNEMTRKRLHDILGLPLHAPTSELHTAADRLLSFLRARYELAGADEGQEQAQLRKEIAALERALARYAPSVVGPPQPGPEAGPPRQVKRPTDRLSLAAAMAGALLTLIFLIWYSGGFAPSEEEPGRMFGLQEPAQLLILGRHENATLFVLDADRERVLAESPAQGAVLELKPGRYALEVRREDCAEQWTRSVFFESGQTYRFEPTPCSPTGTLQLTSNIEGTQLFIDDRAVGDKTQGEHSLPPGEHSIRIEKNGYKVYETKLVVEAGETTEQHAVLESDTSASSVVQPPSPFAFEAPSLDAPAVTQPEPFDLGDLRDSIAPSRKKGGSTRLLERSGLGGLPDGGSTAWHDRVSGEFLGRFDRDASGRIDQLEESESIGCAYWQETEASFEQGGLGLSMARYYGFDGSEWHNGALGFSRQMRGVAYDRMRECGLQT
jgi:hypothetical protein